MEEIFDFSIKLRKVNPHWLPRTLRPKPLSVRSKVMPPLSFFVFVVVVMMVVFVSVRMSTGF
jgi:hypothetical protein